MQFFNSVILENRLYFELYVTFHQYWYEANEIYSHVRLLYTNEEKKQGKNFKNNSCEIIVNETNWNIIIHALQFFPVSSYFNIISNLSNMKFCLSFDFFVGCELKCCILAWYILHNFLPTSSPHLGLQMLLSELKLRHSRIHIHIEYRSC